MLCQVSSNHSDTPKTTCVSRKAVCVQLDLIFFHKAIHDVYNFVTVEEKYTKSHQVLRMFNLQWHIILKHNCKTCSSSLLSNVARSCVLFFNVVIRQRRICFPLPSASVLKWIYRKKSLVDWWRTGDEMFLLSCSKHLRNLGLLTFYVSRTSMHLLKVDLNGSCPHLHVFIVHGDCLISMM